MEKKTKHVIVISEDAMVYEDLETLKTLPLFGKYWDKMSIVKTIRAIYPTVTYPEHTSMRTGVYPDRHGIINNEQTILTELSSDWEWFNDAVKVPDIFDAAKKAGLTTAAVFWPVTGNHPSVDYLVNEYWPQSPEETTVECFENSGSSKEVIDKIVKPNAHLVDGKHRQHPYADRFVHACAAAMIREFKPNLLMIHPANIDSYRHQTGLFSPKVTHGLHEVEEWFGEIVKATEDAGIFEDTTFFIVSDHGQMNINRTISPNVVLAEKGFITVNKKGEVADYKAICKSTALSAQVYLKDPSDQKTYDEVYALLNHMCEEGVYGISRVYTAKEVQQEERLGGDFSFIIETDGFTSFTNHWTRPLVRNLDITDYRFGRATHGHQPDKGPQPTFIAFGPGIKPGVVLERKPIVDEAPTFAKALGFTMPDIDGKPIDEILA